MTPRKRNAAAAEAVVGEKASGEDEMEEKEKSLETGEGREANVIEENPLFEEEQGEEEEPMEIASVETIADAMDEGEPVAKKSKQENDKSEPPKAEILKENMQPEKLKVFELRNALKDRGLDTRGVKTELVERLKAALESKSVLEEAELAAETMEALSKESAEAPSNEAAEIDCEKPKNLEAVESGGSAELLGNEANEDVLNNEEAEGAVSEVSAAEEESKEDSEKGDKAVSENKSEMEKRSLEKEKIEEDPELTETNPVDQAAPIGLRELRPQSTDVLDFEPEEEEVLKTNDGIKEAEEKVKEGDDEERTGGG